MSKRSPTSSVNRSCSSRVAVLAALHALPPRAARRRAAGPRPIAAVCVLYAIACFSKEHGIVLPALLAAAELTVIDDAAPARDRIRRLRPFYLTLALIAVCFVGGALARAVGSRHRRLRAIHPVQRAAHRMARPHPHRARRRATNGFACSTGRRISRPSTDRRTFAIAQGFEHLATPRLPAAHRDARDRRRCSGRRQPVISFGIAFVVLTLLPSSNFVVPAGIVLAERTLFLPSVGAMLVAGGGWRRSLVERLAMRAHGSEPLGLRLDCARWCWLPELVKSFNRTRIWRDNATLFHDADRRSAAGVSRAFHPRRRMSWTTDRWPPARPNSGEALALFPYDPSLSYALAERYRADGLCKPAIPLYKWTYEIDPQYSFGRGMYAWCLLSENRFDEARDMAFASIRVGGSVPSMRRIIAVVDSVKAAAAHEPAAGRCAGARRTLANCQTRCKRLDFTV